MSDMQVNQLMAQMRALAARSNIENIAPPTTVNETNKPEFGDLLKNSINKVNDLQQTSGALSTAFETGTSDVNLVDVMIAKEKAGIAFQAMTQVRNKMVSAYEEVMRMAI
ncbi:flagellar hook-basal body complex protein FliE [Solemya pervernicosa gill symbiont]|uniref:Flagellar hook-basal body complex protein FliE n=1 Tax=Solemya pervernicosa gill symbiont TaxID=642797 RepID=A0A1T2LAJ9_9GAMM|nr:flagellar hook-basal body complex protein FliE [Solemya pervernicosa gill symbiont]OOZ42123.1 flagellar hook-basal body complex protein FliE [Solemya pervernicosa gill symbiont]